MNLELEEEFNLEVEEMARAGLHLGHKTSKLHPKMLPFIFGMRNTIYVIDLEKTKEKFLAALKFLKELAREKKIILFVGTKPAHRELLKNIAQELSFPYVIERWIGGTFTNFKVIKNRLDYLKDLEKKWQEGYFEKYTKKEKLEIEREIKKLNEKFGGMKNLEKLPDAIFVLDASKDKLAIKEAKKMGVKIVAICDTNADPTQVDYPIPANDDAISSVKYILEKVKEAILKGRTNQS